MTNSINEVLGSDVIFITGSNTTEGHPVIGAKIKQAKAKGAKIIVAEPRRIELADYAEVFLQITPGTNVALYNGLMNVILEEGLEDRAFIAERTEKIEDLKELVKEYTPEKVAAICGIDADQLRKAARLYGSAEKGSIFYSMGVTQHSTGTEGVMSLSNLALLTGNIGKESAGVNPLRGQNNVQGACDMGALPNVYTGYQQVANADARKKFENGWGVSLPEAPGLTLCEIVHGAGHGDIRFLYIMGENPMVSDPDLGHVEEALRKVDFLVVQDIFLTETAQLADVVLPAASFAEKDGTFSNTERRVQRVRKAIEPVGKSKPDWVILMELLNRLGIDKKYGHPSEIMEEIAALTPSYAGIDYQRLEQGGLQWPCPTKDHPGTPVLHKAGVARGKGLFKPAHYKPSAELPDAEYPFLLTTGRILFHYHTRTMTGRTEGIHKLFPESYIELSPGTARQLQVEQGDKLSVASRRGAIVTTAKITDRIKDGVVFMPFHFAEGAANALTNSALDPIAKEPEYKVCAVKISTKKFDDRVSDYQ